jgi:galactokinase
VAFRRGKHYVTENTRTKECKISLKLGVWENVGKLMNESHESLKTDFEVSCEEIDLLVETAQKMDGVFGSRITGGGFGGCTVTLVKRESVDDVIKAMKDAFKAKYDKDVECFITLPTGGACVLAADSDCKTN